MDPLPAFREVRKTCPPLPPRRPDHPRFFRAGVGPNGQLRLTPEHAKNQAPRLAAPSLDPYEQDPSTIYTEGYRPHPGSHPGVPTPLQHAAYAHGGGGAYRPAEPEDFVRTGSFGARERAAP